jgi:DNA-binding protein H-NS
LIKLTQDQNDLLKNKLATTCREIQSEQLAEKTQLDYEAAQERKRLDDEADKAAVEKQIATYGRPATLAEKAQGLRDAFKVKRQGVAK